MLLFFEKLGVCLFVRAHVNEGFCDERNSELPGAGVVFDCEPFDVGARN